MSQSLPSHIYSVMVSLVDTSLILPNSAVVEVLGQDVMRAVEDGPAWLLGQARWRQFELPAISLEGMLGQAVPPMDRKCRLVVLNTPSQAAAFAVVARSYPLIVTLNEVALKPVELAEDEAASLVLSRVKVANRSALIPELDAMADLVRPYGEV